jgi:outer membrane protein
MGVAKWAGNPTTMFTPRRLIALLFSSILALSASAQTAPVVEEVVMADGEKISLDEAIRRALEKNFSIKADRFDVSIANARLTEAFGKFDPVISGSYTYSESYNPSLADATTGVRPGASFGKSDSADVGLGGLLPWGMTYRVSASSLELPASSIYGPDASTYDVFAGASVTQPLLRNFGFGPTLASIRIAQVNRNISQWFFKQSVINTITDVIFAYHNLNFAYANQRSAIGGKKLALQLLEENRKRFKVGSMSEYDVAFAESRAAQRDESVLTAQRSVAIAENALKQLITDDKTPELLKQRLTIEPPPPSPIVMVDAALDFRIALEKRPDYQQAKLALKRDGINTRLARNQLLPRVDLVGSYGYNGLDTELGVSRQQIKDEEYRAYSWGVVVSVPLTFTTERGRYRAARLQQRQSETNLDLIEQDIVVRVGNAAGQITTTRERVQSTRRARELAQYVLDSEFKRLRAGTSTSFQVANQQELLSIAEVREAAALADYARAIAEYDRQLGVTLEKLNITLEQPK